MKKKLFALFLAGMMILSLVACTEANPSTDSGIDTNPVSNTSSVRTETDAVTDSASDVSSDASTDTSSDLQQSTDSATQTSSDLSDESQDVEKPFGFDPDLEHKVILTDNTHAAIVVLDLNKSDMKNVDWRTDTSLAEAIIYTMNYGMDSAKYRYSPYYQQDIIVATSSEGYLYVYEYNPKENSYQRLLFVFDCKANEQEISLYNAHSAEMLPNGDIVVATSGYQKDGDGSNYRNGGIHYYPAGSNKRSAFLSLPFAHAAVWDDKNQCLWAIGFEGIVAIKINGSGENVTLEKIEGKGYKAKSAFRGHDMVPAFGMDGKYWVSEEEGVYLFDTANNTLTKAEQYSYDKIKGMAYFADGTMIMSDWTKYLLTHVVDPATQKTTATPCAIKNQVYKINVFTKNYS